MLGCTLLGTQPILLRNLRTCGIRLFVFCCYFCNFLKLMFIHIFQFYWDIIDIHHWINLRCISLVIWVTTFVSWFSSVQFSPSVVSDFLWSHELQHARPPCPSPTPEVHQNPCPLSWWCHPTISSSVITFSSCLQYFPASGSFQWVSCPHHVAKVLEFQLQHQSFQWTPRTDLL